ncbi:MAG: hypothetical protein PVJ55_08055, partial [Anaerolineae bacterium]
PIFPNSPAEPLTEDASPRGRSIWLRGLAVVPSNPHHSSSPLRDITLKTECIAPIGVVPGA